METEKVRKPFRAFAPRPQYLEALRQLSENRAWAAALANQVLSQLSYRPQSTSKIVGRGQAGRTGRLDAQTHSGEQRTVTGRTCRLPPAPRLAPGRLGTCRPLAVYL